MGLWFAELAAVLFVISALLVQSYEVREQHRQNAEIARLARANEAQILDNQLALARVAEALRARTALIREIANALGIKPPAKAVGADPDDLDRPRPPAVPEPTR